VCNLDKKRKGRAGSINYQVAKIIKAHNGIGKSKADNRQISGIRSAESGHQLSNLVHSYKSLDNLRADLTNLAKYAKAEYAIKDMSKIDAMVVKSWISSKGVTYNTASNYLSEINKVSEHLSISREDVKVMRVELKQTLSKNKSQTRYYKGLDKIELPARSQPAFELQRDYGLRVSASTYINIERQIKGNIFSYREKGGKVSEKELSNTLISKIRDNAVDGIYKLTNAMYRRDLKSKIEDSGQKFNGTHGIRHTYAQDRLEKGATKKEVSEAMGHTREEITNVYLR